MSYFSIEDFIESGEKSLKDKNYWSALSVALALPSMKDNNKKEIKYLNACMDKALHEEFEQFCKAHGMSKVGATEQSIRQYMDKMNKALKNVK